MTDLVLYIIVRNDLHSMNPGKAAAHAAHAANMCQTKLGDMSLWREWADGRGFGTTIVLAADLEAIKGRCYGVISDADYFYGIVEDPEYPFTQTREMYMQVRNALTHSMAHPWTRVKDIDDHYCVFTRKEITAGYMFGERDSLEYLVGNLSLMA